MALYGLRQELLRWYLNLRETLAEKLGSTQLESNGAVFKKIVVTQNLAKCSTKPQLEIVLIYVDDFLFIAETAKSLDKICNEFLNVFEGSREPLHWYLAVKIDEVEEKQIFSQKPFINECLEHLTSRQ